MKAIRGATTVSSDNAAEIQCNVKELLVKTIKANGLCEDNIICIMFSNTSDIHSYYPAKAAREAGFVNCALYSSLEPEITSALKLCIRIMIIAETDNKPQHIYLRGAESLRRDITSKLTIAIDGPAGSGKSTISKIIAKKFDILYLDTGAMYRACALACVRASIDCRDGKSVKELINHAQINVNYKDGAQVTLLNGEDVSEKIRYPEISMLASTVSAHEHVRAGMVELQRQIASDNSCVLDGRDIGTNVLPNAGFKYFLTASAEVRAKRRLLENTQKGINQTYNEVLNDIKTRDEQDRTRRIAPLVKAVDAIEIDTSEMSIDEVAELIIKSIQEKI